MKRIIPISCLLFVLTVVLTACGSKNSISEELGIDISGGKELAKSDSHGGFHGDGTTYITFRFSDDKVLEQIKENAQWKAFPLDETVRTLVYGMPDETSSGGPFLKDNEGNAFVPEIQNGYFILVDRQTEAGKATGADILHRSSFNFTLGIYDTDTKILYYCKLDT